MAKVITAEHTLPNDIFPNEVSNTWLKFSIVRVLSKYTLVKPFSDDEDIFNPNLPKVVLNAHSEAIYFSRSPIPFLRNLQKEEWQKNHKYLKHIGLYAYRSDILKQITSLPVGNLEKLESLEQLRWLENGYNIKVAETQFESYAIDTPEDLERLLKVLQKTIK